MTVSNFCYTPAPRPYCPVGGGGDECNLRIPYFCAYTKSIFPYILHFAPLLISLLHPAPTTPEGGGKEEALKRDKIRSRKEK